MEQCEVRRWKKRHSIHFPGGGGDVSGRPLRRPPAAAGGRHRLRLPAGPQCHRRAGADQLRRLVVARIPSAQHHRHGTWLAFQKFQPGPNRFQSIIATVSLPCNGRVSSMASEFTNANLELVALST